MGNRVSFDWGARWRPIFLRVALNRVMPAMEADRGHVYTSKPKRDGEVAFRLGRLGS
jgi:hypothetical protein